MFTQFPRFSREGLAETLSRPGIRLHGWRRLPLLSKVAVCFLAVVVLVALSAPSSRPTTRSTSGSPSTAPDTLPPTTGWARTVSAGTSSAG